MLAQDNFRKRHLYRGKVSLRECFFFLGQEIKSGNYKVSYSMSKDGWFGRPKPSKNPIDALDSDYISETDDEGFDSSDDSSTADAPAAREINHRRGALHLDR